MKQAFLIFISVFALSGCDFYKEFTKEYDYSATATDQFSYDLLNEKKKYFMSYSLEELSGLSYVRKSTLACVQDESGKLYLYDTKKKAITKRIKFHKGGDYEGVEVIDETAYVIKSNGTIYSFPLESGDKVDAEKISTPLTAENDVEGLGYDPTKNHLLIICKAKAGIKDENIRGKAVYSFDPITKKISKKPVLVLTKKTIKDFLNKMNRDDTVINFKPSGIALHPIEDRYYIITSAGKILMVVDRNGNIDEYVKLKPSMFRQPEGICFSPDGDMYIGNEGDGMDGYILKFKYK